MRKEVSFQLEDVIEIPNWTKDYPEHKFTVFKACFLSTAKNSHDLTITADVLRKCAPTILANFLTAKIQWGDAKSHEDDEVIYGYAPIGQEVEFVESDGILKAYCYFVVSKRYSKEFNDIFEFDNLRNSSVEMTVEQEEGKSDVISFDIYGLTCLNKRINGSCPDADIKMVRFSQEDAEAYFMKNDKLSQLKKFAQERKNSMAENYVSHPIDTSKKAMYDGEWDGNQVKQDLVKEKNYESLAPKVCLRLEDGWKDREVTKLGYPVMMLHEGKWVYSRRALGSAKSYAEQNNEEEVLSELKRIYKTLGLEWEKSGKEEDKKMAKEVEFAAVNIGDMWGKLYDAIHARYPDGDWDSVYRIDGIYEEGNKKFAVVHRRDEDVKYRLDFSLTEEGLELAEEIVKVEIEIVETDDVRKFAEPEDADKFKKFEDDEPDDDKDVEMSCDEKEAEMARMKADIESRDNIIMEKDKELEELRQFKCGVEAKEKAMAVESVMAEVKEFLDDAQFNTMREEGMACEHGAIDAWSNKVRAMCFSAVKKNNGGKKSTLGVWGFAAPIEMKKSGSLWENTGNKKNSSLWD